jgi:RNA polymerase sigma factor (sigma-70 family)
MSENQRFHVLDTILSRLPFLIDETDRVNVVFLRWQDAEAPEDKQIVDVWTYAFIYRYFTMKFLHRPGAAAADLDLSIEQAFKKVQAHLHKPKQIERYASWVSVVCRNTFINYLRAQQKKQMVSMDILPESDAVFAVEPQEIQFDDAVLERLLRAAIARLPVSLRRIAHLRFVENWSYDRISTLMETPLPQVRTYAHRAALKLRKDFHLLAYFKQASF